MSAVDEILQQIPLNQLANQVDADPDTTEQAVRQLVPALIGGMQSNAADPQGEVSLAQALSDHGNRGLLDGGLDLNQVDPTDGEKIVQHIFGNSPQNIQQLGGVQGSLVQRLLPLLAPIVLGYLAKRMGAGAGAGAGQGGGFGDILGSILGGGGGLGQQAQQAPQQSGGGLSDILGQILGGGSGFGTEQQVPQQTQQQSPFDAPQQNDGGLRMDDSLDEDPRARQQQSGGGILDAIKDALGGGR